MKRFESYPANTAWVFILTLIFITVFAIPAFCYEIDTMRIREKPEESTTFGEAVMAVPSFILNSPFWIIKNVSDFTVNEIVYSDIIQTLFALKFRPIWGFYPTGGYNSNAGVKGGIVYRVKDLFSEDEDFKVKASYSTNDYQTYSARYRIMPQSSIFNEVHFNFSYRQKPRESFYGIGNRTSDIDEVAFNLETGFMGFGWNHSISGKLQAGVDFSYRIMNIYDGQDPSLTGSLDLIQDKFNLSDEVLADARLLTVGMNLAYDWRDHPGQAASGGYNALEISYNRGRGQLQDLEYFLASVNLYQFIHIYRQRVLVLNFRTETVGKTDQSPDLPFYLRPSLGGEESLHGYKEHRFIDNTTMLAAVEYRFPLLQGMDGFLFFEEGRVFDDFSEDFDLKNWHYSTGIGMRLWDQEGLRFSAFAAFSKESPQFYVQLSETL
ncbi:MAG: BamA/TamA family outer membrane protein [candidate division Zixibacteria bacterium]|nr:BamA/TamA family outer membrane protein [candidate division Zixibacteria bacterium]NIR66360.1 BamA/TamA family outer membrane protein [candidate division Zixibacteria bacterium]NIS17981.1 BamA/TamA family outer membrane protein [candidate division Zixibacteria bacterium]NIS47962.1 BamA/TamA family outer membrane protein [candidate division Zixibacteria bacterium]NIT54264.1 BamA/TamA family outer membrane protein [candidate division Zixibacteria bacterium]